MASLSDDRRDQMYREAIGWPLPVQPDRPAAVVADLRAFLADVRRRRALRQGRRP